MGQLSVVVLVMVLSGLCAGLLGIGGALVFNPFLLQMGVHPQVRISLLWFLNLWVSLKTHDHMALTRWNRWLLD